ncbi:MAG: hypothetical protein H6669_13750 [Ardenticatenaceae bacterium]|nr:hypothetical protein [Ardenticatenaceae bacterium]
MSSLVLLNSRPLFYQSQPFITTNGRVPPTYSQYNLIIMAYRLDPEDRETLALFDFVGDFAGKRVLEIGQRLFNLALRRKKVAHVNGIDPNKIERAVCCA